MTEPVLTLNFINAAKEYAPKNVPTTKFTGAMFPNFGDSISFPGIDAWFLVHSRHFSVGSDGVVSITLNLDLVKETPTA